VEIFTKRKKVYRVRQIETCFELRTNIQIAGYIMKKWPSIIALMACVIYSATAWSQSYSPPAGLRPALKRPGASILPGGRVIAPPGDQFVTGPRPFTMAISPSGKIVLAANLGPAESSLTILEHNATWDTRQLHTAAFQIGSSAGEAAWKSVSTGLAFSGEHSAFI